MEDKNNCGCTNNDELELNADTNMNENVSEENQHEHRRTRDVLEETQHMRDKRIDKQNRGIANYNDDARGMNGGTVPF